MKRLTLVAAAMAVTSMLTVSQTSAMGWRMWRCPATPVSCYVAAQRSATTDQADAKPSQSAEDATGCQLNQPLSKLIVPFDADQGPYRVYRTWKCWDDEGARECGWDYTNYDRPRDVNYSNPYDPD